EDLGGKVEVAAQEGCRHGQERKGPEEPPREVAGPPELPRANAGDENVKQQRGGFDHRGSQAEEGHDRDVTGRARMADRGVEDGHQQNAGSQKGKLFGGHRSKRGSASPSKRIRMEVWLSE